MKNPTNLFKLLLACCVLFTFSPRPKAATDTAMSEQDVTNEAQTVLHQLDSAAFSRQVSDDEFIVKAYLLVKDREPDTFEFYYCQSLFSQDHLTRSNLLALLLAGADNGITWNQCRNFLKHDPLQFLKDTGEIQHVVERLKNITPQKRTEVLQNRLMLNRGNTDKKDESGASSNNIGKTAVHQSVAGEFYHTYFGYLHAHTSFSDGKGTPIEAYRYARDTGKLDFFTLTDHGEMLGFWPWQKKWDKIKAAAESCYLPGQFVTFWGFEWTNPLLGHINVINTDNYTNCLARIGLSDLYSWLKAYPGGIASFNHPGLYNALGTEFLHLEKTNTQAIPQMVGIETWNGSHGFAQYFYKNRWKGCNYSYLDTGNRNGWQLGALGGQDNHGRDWGTKNECRTAVLATDLTREAILEAYQNRRFYATEDCNLYLDIRCCGYPMGSQISGVTRTFTVKANDGNGDMISEIRFYRNGDLIATQAVTGSNAYAAFSDYETTEAAYYYVIVKETDDNDGDGRNDEAISSPIWVR